MNESFVPDYKYRDEALNTANTERYVLSIQFALDGFSFAVLSRELGKFLALETFSMKDTDTSIKFCKKLDAFFESYSWLKNPFHDVYVLFESPKSTLVPEPLFDESEKGLFMNFNQELSAYEQLRSDYLKNTDAYLIYTLPDCFKYRIDRYIREKHLLHFASPLIESLLITYKNKDVSNKVFLHVRRSFLDIIILNSQGLRFFNSFQYSMPEDLIYYLLFVFDQLEFNPEDVELQLMGDIRKLSREYELLYTYVRNVDFESPTSRFGYSYVFDKVPGHMYYNLFNVNICGL